MKTTIKNVVLSASLVLSLVTASAFSTTLTPVTLVQSVPEATELSQAGMPHARDTWVRMIDEAKETIDVEQMYVSGDQGKAEATNAVLSALEAASARGVKIRLVLSKNMIGNDPLMLERLKAIPTLTLYVVDYSKITGGIQHAKFWIIDGKNTFLGSQNLDYLALTQIHEVGVEIQDAVLAARMRAIFEVDVRIAQTGEIPADLGVAPATPENSDVELVASPPSLNPSGIRPAIDALKELLARAKSSIQIQVMEYSVGSSGKEWLEIDQAIREAAARGVKVQLLVSHWNTSKPGIQSIKNLSGVPNIEVRICTIPDLPTGHTPYSRLIHSKYMVIDDSVLWVGSSNWSKGYFTATRGLEMILKRPDLASTAVKMFETVWSQPYTAPVDVNRDYPKPVK